MSTETLPYRQLGGIGRNFGKIKNKKIFSVIFTKKNAILLPASFLLGRASLAAGLMPFGMAIYTSTYGLDLNRALIAICVILGMISGGAREQIYITVAGMLLFNAINIPLKDKGKSRLKFKYAVIAFISVLLPELVAIYFQGFLLFDVLKALFHAFIAFTLMFIFRNVTPIITDIPKKHIYTNEEMISVAIFMALALSGLTNIQILGFGIKNILCILVILIFSYKCGPGVGSAAGVTIGLLVSMYSTSTPLLIGSYAFCGLLAGVFKSLGKVGSSLGFVMGNAVLTLYLNGSTDVLIYLKEIIAAVVIVMIIPEKLIELIAGSFNRNVDTCVDKRSYSSRIKEITVDKLNKFSNAFKELSKTFSEISETKIVTDKQDISILFDRVADRVCKDCSLCLHCWDRNFYNTYQVMFKIIEKLDSKGHIEAKDIPDYFLDRCERINDFVDSVNNMYEIFKVNTVWKGKIGESRALVSQQLDGLSRVISNLASEIDVDLHFKSELEDSILMELNRGGVKANEVIVYENKWGKYEISIFQKACGGKRDCISITEKLVSDIVGRKMTKESGDCGIGYRRGACNIKLVEEEAFSVTTGIARAAKENADVSGDNYTFMNNGDGKYIVALSDGMGSGRRANVQSRATINLLEQFMESGFDKDTTVKLINSILVLKSSDDSFATIDMSLIDLFSGEVEFVKVGAVPTFIKKKERIETIKSASLPAGILSDLEVELVHKKVDSGDFIIMISDGILDSFNLQNDSENELLDYISQVDTINPQEMAKSILDKAYSNCGQNPIDDMIVLVAKVWKRVA